MTITTISPINRNLWEKRVTPKTPFRFRTLPFIPSSLSNLEAVMQRNDYKEIGFFTLRDFSDLAVILENPTNTKTFNIRKDCVNVFLINSDEDGLKAKTIFWKDGKVQFGVLNESEFATTKNLVFYIKV
jgi:hypothetical protein